MFVTHSIRGFVDPGTASLFFFPPMKLPFPIPTIREGFKTHQVKGGRDSFLSNYLSSVNLIKSNSFTPSL